MTSYGSKEARHTKWKELLEEWGSSGMSLAKFAQMHKVGLSTLTRYKARFGPSTTSQQHVSGPRIVPVVPQPATVSCHSVELVLRNGCAVRLTLQNDPTVLTQLLRCMESL